MGKGQMGEVCAQGRICYDIFIKLKSHNTDSTLQPELKEIGFDFLNKEDEVIMDGTEREAEEEGDSETRDILDSGEVTQHDKEDEEGCPELMNRGRDEEDSDKESENEEEMRVDKDKKVFDEVLSIKEKGGSLTEEVYDEMEGKEKGVKRYTEINGKDNAVEIPFGVMKKDEPISLAKCIKRYCVEASRQN
eukprot:3410819-Ditylum_brightwellii.AAC.1